MVLEGLFQEGKIFYLIGEVTALTGVIKALRTFPDPTVTLHIFCMLCALGASFCAGPHSDTRPTACPPLLEATHACSLILKEPWSNSITS